MQKIYSRRDFIKLIGAGTVVMAVPACLEFKSKPGHNFVFFLIDDMGWKDGGCYGSKFYETPHIDRLAANGMRFTDAYAACPVCSPTRASILSGKHPVRVNITDWIPGLDPKDRKLLGTEDLHQLPLSEVTIAEAFKEIGYATAFMGKWHLGDKGYFPEQQGFDINKGGHWAGQPASYFFPYKNERKRWDVPGLEGGEEGEYLTDRLTTESVKFIEQNKDKPFLLYLSHYAVHTPIQSKPELEERIIQKLDELKLSENTVIIFMSDNGGLSTLPGDWKSPTSNLPLRAGKGWLYEGGIREPMIIKWPGVTEPGSICREPVISMDFFPTMLEMAGLSLFPEQHVDGCSLVPLLCQTGGLKRNELFWHFPHYHGSGSIPSGAVRSGDYKLIEWFEDGSIELYNLKDDISEKHDLAASKPEKADELLKKLKLWRDKIGAKMPEQNIGWKARNKEQE